MFKTIVHQDEKEFDKLLLNFEAENKVNSRNFYATSIAVPGKKPDGVIEMGKVTLDILVFYCCTYEYTLIPEHLKEKGL